MRKYRKVLALALAIVGTLGSLAGCSPASSDASADGIEIWYRPGSIPTAAVKGVKAAFPNDTIRLVETPDVDTKLVAALRTKRNVPDIAVALLSQYTSATNRFVDVNTSGFKEVSNDYLPWKVKMGQDGSGRQIGIPVDIGPFGFFYRADVFQQAGLPSDPAAVGKLVATWPGYERVAKKVTSTTGSSICDAASSNYVTQRLQHGDYFTTDSGQYASTSAANRKQFLGAVQFGKKGLCQNVEQFKPEWSSAVAQGKLTGWVGPSYVAGAMKSAGGPGAGKWRVTTPPGGAASQFGSFLSVLKTSKNPSKATKVAIWLTNAKNQAAGFEGDSLFPSTPASYDMSEMTKPDKFYGGQAPAQILSHVAEKAPRLTIVSQSDKASTIYTTAIDETVQSRGSGASAYEVAAKEADDLR